MDSDRCRPDPELLLKQVEAEERHACRGKLKIFLGYASGVGKSFRMLDEGRRRRKRGRDVILAAVQPSLPPEVEELIADFEVIPPKADLGVPIIDVPAILKRRPSVCLIDGLAYDNPPGSKNAHRWQDVEELLVAGINVVTSINLQYIAEYQQQVEAIRGKIVRESVPQAFIRTADEIEVVDAPPEYCLPRSLNANSSPLASAELERQLSELREMALLLTADVVDHQLEEYLRRKGIEQHYGTLERILVCITPRSDAALMIRRGRRQADRFHGELFVLYVEQEGLSARDRGTMDKNLARAREAEAHVEVLKGKDPVAAILRFARANGITQIFVGHSRAAGWLAHVRPNAVERLILDSAGIDVRIFPNAEARYERC